MWLLRREQVRAFEEAALADFERRAAEHLERTLPAQCAALGPEAVRERVSRARVKAQGFGITAEVDVLMFLNLTFLLGPDFETDPRYGWAERVLAASDVEAASRVRVIWQRATRELFP